MADNFYENLGATGALGESLLERAGQNRYKTKKGKRRADTVALIGGLLGIGDKYLAKNAMNAYQKFEQNLLPEKEFLISNYEDRQKFINDVEKRGGTVQFVSQKDDPRGYRIINENRILESFKNEVLDNELKEKQRSEMILGVPSGMSTLSGDYTNYLNGRAEEEAKEFLSTGGRYQWDKRTQADYLASYKDTLTQAQIDMMSPRNTSVVRKVFGLFGDKNAQQSYEKKRDTLLDNHNRFRQKADYITDYDNEFDEVNEANRYKYSPNQNTITELVKAYRNGEASTQSKSESEFVDEINKKFEDYITAHGINKNTLTSANAFVFTSSILDQDEIAIKGDHDKTKLRLQDLNPNYDPSVSLSDQSPEIQTLYDKTLKETRRKRLSFDATAAEKLENILDEVETVTAQIQAGTLTSEQAESYSQAYRNSIAYTPPSIFKSYKNTAIDNIAGYSVEKLEQELVTINSSLGFDDESSFQLKTASDLANYQALLRTVLYFDSRYENNPEEFSNAINSLGPLMSETTQDILLKSFREKDEQGISIITPNI